jgi:hypothetical protein
MFPVFLSLFTSSFLPIPSSLVLLPFSVLPVPYSLFPTEYRGLVAHLAPLFPVPYSLFPTVWCLIQKPVCGKKEVASKYAKGYH